MLLQKTFDAMVAGAHGRRQRRVLRQRREDQPAVRHFISR
jgi:hypothetical protein